MHNGANKNTYKGYKTKYTDAKDKHTRSINEKSFNPQWLKEIWQ